MSDPTTRTTAAGLPPYNHDAAMRLLDAIDDPNWEEKRMTMTDHNDDTLRSAIAHCPPSEATKMTVLATGAVETIAAQANYVRDLVNNVEARLYNAAHAGSVLAAAVYRFVEDPEAVGTDALQAAYRAFMGQHSAGFTDSAREATDGT